MNKIDLVGLDKEMYVEELENGLKVYMIPYDEKNNYSMHYVAKFGSVDTSFIPFNEDKMIKVPDGIAHFLEHKMFESEDGIDPFSVASITGTDCNASTGYKCTRYLFEGTKGFEENLDYLLTYVNSPYFTDENVEKEKGIIIEELLQYQDLVDFRLDNLIKENLFVNDPMRIDIGGTVESVKSITKEDLYKTYNTFYQPSNMFIVITGKFDKDKAIEIIKNNKALQERNIKFEIVREKIEEPEKTKNKYIEEKFDSNSIKCAYSIKFKKNKENEIIDSMYYSMALNMAFGSTSDFREEMKKKELYTNFFYEKDLTDDYFIISFIAETDKPKELIEEIKNTLKNIEITQEKFTRIKKVWIASEVMMIDNIDATLDNIVSDIITYGEIFTDRIETIRNLELDKLKKLIKNTDISNDSTVIIYPKEI